MPHLTRRQVLAGLLVSTAGSAMAGAPATSIFPQYRPRKIRLDAAGSVDDLIAAADLGGKIGFVVADAATGEILESRNPLLALPPASVAKAVTTLYGLEALGPGHRFATRVLITGPLVNGRVEGDLYLVGGGDPTLDTDALGELAKRLKAAGVREISGKARVWADALPYQRSIDSDQPEYLGYNPSLSGLNLNFNRVFFEWKRQKDGFEVTMDARALKYRPRVAMSTMTVVDRTAPIFDLTSTASTDEWTVASRALGKRGGRWLPVRRPEFYASEVFHTIARAHGIDLPGFTAARNLPGGTVVAEWQSEPLQDILRGMLKYSTNLIAEAVGLSASQARGRSPATLSASGRMMGDWVTSAGAAKHAKFVDHSGLGDASRMSASDMVRVLVRAGWNGQLHDLMKDIPFHDDDGKRLKNPPVNVQAKTGTLNFVSALAGYAQSSGGRRLVFAIFAADMPRRDALPKSQRERPRGGRAWNGRAKDLQQKLLERWALVFDAA
ncbi:MAG: D-alanyl-D-alanine carboxypeptidase/D-alanyl-D-alanine-endopeptidase [Rhodobacteraceae bacterium]|nr:D-alanyl-D-alanine carboxypeptidase/D-alanyl-D-alanine-endopeptidase [Paracoccaceae bacterium]